MKIIKKLAAIATLPGAVFLSQASADTLENATRLFEFAEASYPELLSPASPETQEIQGFYVRQYADSGIYLGVQGDVIWVSGAQFGETAQVVGRLGDFIQTGTTDISDAILGNRRGVCSYYADSLVSAVRDIQKNTLYNGSLTITVDTETNECVLSTNSIPNHDFHDANASFVTDVTAISDEFRIPLQPTFASASTAMSLTYDNALLLNGVKVDLIAAACYNVGDEKIGCNDINQPWRFDPMSPENDFGTDSHNAHTQPDGTYHYHGNPVALFDQSGTVESPVVGFAADGFPVFGTYINDNGQIRAVTSSYQLKSGTRPSSADDPGGTYNGQYIDDYEYVAGLGDLDECNGMMRDGVYGYYIVNAYPWVLKCYKGTVNESFSKAPGNDSGGSGGDTGGSSGGAQQSGAGGGGGTGSGGTGGGGTGGGGATGGGGGGGS